MSSAPWLSISCAPSRPCITQNTLTCGTLSNSSRETAKVLIMSAPVAMVVLACSRLRMIPSLESWKSCW